MWNNPVILSRISLFVSSTAFVFQTNVLYPWHKEISKDLQKIHNSITSKNQ